MTDITIPPEALEAAARAIYLVFTEINIGDGEDHWERLQPRFRAEYREEARAACLAMLKAWPGSYSLAENDSAVIRDVAAIILPLPQEPRDE